MPAKLDRQNYIRDCYRGKTGYADGVPLDILQAVHIESGLEDAIVAALKMDLDIVLTGNPGDGKTHLLRLLQGRIQKTKPGTTVVLDASQLTNEEIISAWRKAKTPFCIAVNEGVLKDLADADPGLECITAAQEQVENAVRYYCARENPTATESSNVSVFDISRRNVLTKPIVDKMLDRLTDESIFPTPPECDSPENNFVLHRQVLRHVLFRSRLQAILDQVSQTGFHATIRDLQGFISYLLFRGVSYSQLAEECGDDAHFVTELVFTGDGPLFDAIRRVFDPSNVSHPVWDERLLAADIEPQTWTLDWAAPVNAITIRDVSELYRRRRRFYFLNENGDAYRQISDTLSHQYVALLAQDERDCIRNLLRSINAAFGSSMEDGKLRIWESHHYDHKSETVLYSARSIERREFEIAKPSLRPPMSKAFEIPIDHLQLRLKASPALRLVIDYDLFGLLCQAAAGVPVLSLRSHLTRRLWQFMEQLAAEHSVGTHDECDVTVRDIRTGRQATVTIDQERRQYVALKEE